MPIRLWAHDCGCAGREGFLMTCRSCGEHGKDLGWRMTEDERTRALYLATGMLPSARSRMSPDGQDLIARLVRCPLCEGDGIVQSAGRRDVWAWCPSCGGKTAALDGDFRGYAGDEDPALVGSHRLCSTGYTCDEEHVRHVRGDLDDKETALVQRILKDATLETAPLLPAVRTLDGSLLVIGPTHSAILRRAWLKGIPIREDTRIVEGFVQSESGRFLDRRHAMAEARGGGLTRLPFSALQGEWLPYHEAVPFAVIRTDE